MPSKSPERLPALPIQMEWVINQGAEIDHYQPLLFVVDSFEHLFDLVDQMERWSPFRGSHRTRPDHFDYIMRRAWSKQRSS